MAIQFHCERCQSVLEALDDQRGKHCRCPGCGHTMQIPELLTDDLLESSDAPAEDQFSSSETNPYAEPLQPTQPQLPPPQSTENLLRPHRGESVLAFGLISLCFGLVGCACCFLFFPINIGFGIAAIVMSKTDLKLMDDQQMDPRGRGITQAGQICGLIGIVLSCLAVAQFVLTIALQVGAAGFGMR